MAHDKPQPIQAPEQSKASLTVPSGDLALAASLPQPIVLPIALHIPVPTLVNFEPGFTLADAPCVSQIKNISKPIHGEN
jgi:hypothetical protein